MSPTDDCIEHKGCKLPNGYGKIGRNSKTWLAHRYAWFAAKGPIPEGMHVCHTCDNRACINVNHLFLGTRVDNMQDMIAKGRAKFVGLQSPNYRYPKPKYGSDNPRAKINQQIADEIRAAPGLDREIAIAFGVSPATVWRVRAGISWARATT